MCVCVHAQSCPSLCDPMDCSPPGSSVHGISQARILEWVAISCFRGSSWPTDWIQVSCLGRQILHCLRYLESVRIGVIGPKKSQEGQHLSPHSWWGLPAALPGQIELATLDCSHFSPLKPHSMGSEVWHLRKVWPGYSHWCLRTAPGWDFSQQADFLTPSFLFGKI